MTALRIGVACFSTFGGSGVVAAEVAMSLAGRGHRLHVFSDGVPGRLDPGAENVSFHPVAMRDFPQIRHPPYTLALTSKIVEVARRERLDLVHAHYAVPHAASAYLARQVISADGALPPLRIVTTLHGTDITLVGSDESFLPLTRFSIMASDAVTVPSVWLREMTFAALDVPRTVAIEVVPNFVDTERFSPPAAGATRDPSARVIVHVSNFRPLKRAEDVINVLARVRAAAAGEGAVLRLVGDGPERPRVVALARALGLETSVEVMGEQHIDLPAVLRGADVFLLPSEIESFGLAALEAMACGVPVVASAVGGLPEVLTEGESGFLRPVGDVGGMADAVLRLFADRALAARMSAAARRRAEAAFSREPAVDRYLDVYRRALGSA